MIRQWPPQRTEWCQVVVPYVVVSDWIGRDQLSGHQKCSFHLIPKVYLTNDIPVCIAVLKVSNGSDRGGLKCIPSRW